MVVQVLKYDENGKPYYEDVELDKNGLHCDNCTTICSSNKNPKFHPDDERRYNERMNEL